MQVNIERRTKAASLIAIFVFMISSPVFSADALDVPSNINIGPFVDKVVFKVIQDHDQLILALQSGEIDLHTRHFLPSYLQSLEEDPDISIYSSLRNGYGHFTINCEKYPLNITGFRRAFAYAFDKTRVKLEVLDGLSQEHDSLVPYVSEFCIEDQLPYHYYTAQPEIGNQILDELGFKINPVTGFRTAPDGSLFRVVIEYVSLSQEVAGSTSRIAVDALHSLHIDASALGTGFNFLISKLDNHQDYDIAFYAYNFLTKNPDWLVEEFWSKNADVPYMNPCNFVNKTYDSWCDVLRSSMTFPEAYDAAAAMQLILHENVPRLVAYENYYNQAYRTDVFTGHVPDLFDYISGPWTLRKIHRIDGNPGGTVRVGTRSVYSFNIFQSGMGIFAELLWPSLYSMAPDLGFCPYIAESLLMETHAENTRVPDGHTRFTVDIIRNATWSDGTPLTAYDLAFTYTYLYETIQYGNPSSAILGDLVAAYAPTTHRAIIEFNTESMWHQSTFALAPIIPKHIFLDEIGYENWNSWNPVYNPEDPFITSGPFTLTQWQDDAFYEFTANPDFCYYPEERIPSSSNPTPSTDPGTPFNISLALTAGAVGAAVTVLVGGFILFKPKVA